MGRKSDFFCGTALDEQRSLGLIKFHSPPDQIDQNTDIDLVEIEECRYQSAKYVVGQEELMDYERQEFAQDPGAMMDEDFESDLHSAMSGVDIDAEYVPRAEREPPEEQDEGMVSSEDASVSAQSDETLQRWMADYINQEELATLVGPNIGPLGMSDLRTNRVKWDVPDLSRSRSKSTNLHKPKRDIFKIIKCDRKVMSIPNDAIM